ncbi:hypothetical protein AB0N38_14110 [Micromonospora aurantiaca]|uniref:hypothetical protein n=1 Tax=Micromonospora aurantiaca (nom. illeg.) TaxID=47850 RepID=UPI0034303897
MTVNMSATFKKDERINNGLERIARALVKDPLTRHVVVGVIECTRITRDIADGGVETPTVRFALIEVLDGDDAEQARQLLDAAHNARTGKSPAPTLFDTTRDPDDVVDAEVYCGATDDQGRTCGLIEHDDDTEHDWREPAAGGTGGFVDPVKFMDGADDASTDPAGQTPVDPGEGPVSERQRDEWLDDPK